MPSLVGTFSCEEVCSQSAILPAPDTDPHSLDFSKKVLFSKKKVNQLHCYIYRYKFRLDLLCKYFVPVDASKVGMRSNVLDVFHPRFRIGRQ